MTTATATLPSAAPRPSLGSRVFGVLQKLGRALMIPVAVLPAAGILLGSAAACWPASSRAFTRSTPHLSSTC